MMDKIRCKGENCQIRNNCYRFRRLDDSSLMQFERSSGRCEHWLPLLPNSKLRPMAAYNEV